MLVLLFTIGNTIINVPALVTIEAKHDAWLASIISLIIGLLLVGLLDKLGSRFPDLNIFEYSEKLLGSIIGKVIIFLLTMYFLILSALMIRQVGDFLTIQIMPETPIEVIIITFLVVMIMGVRLGIEPVARNGEMFLPFVFILLLFMVIFHS